MHTDAVIGLPPDFHPRGAQLKGAFLLQFVEGQAARYVLLMALCMSSLAGPCSARSPASKVLKILSR